LKKKDLTVEAREALGSIWNSVLSKGRTWGSKAKANNPYAGTNITMIDEDEVVIVNQIGEELMVREFERTGGTTLGSKVKIKLAEAGLLKRN